MTILAEVPANDGGGEVDPMNHETMKKAAANNFTGSVLTSLTNMVNGQNFGITSGGDNNATVETMKNRRMMFSKTMGVSCPIENCYQSLQFWNTYGV